LEEEIASILRDAAEAGRGMNLTGTCWFLARLTFYPKPQADSEIYGFIIQKTLLNIVTVVRTSNPRRASYLAGAEVINDEMSDCERGMTSARKQYSVLEM
jgi:hypothetical protein